MTSLRRFLDDPYGGYAYAYPHKTAYRPFEPPRALADVWADEDKRQLFLYVHVPFCEMRCGFCNLFTYVGSEAEAHARYVRAVARQAQAVGEALGSERRFSRLAFGGGTPTFLSPEHLDGLLAIAAGLGASADAIPTSVEVSPLTADEARLDLLEGAGVERISIGVQSFDDEELRALGRPSTGEMAREALGRIRARRLPRLNVDLIYGMAGQTTARFARAIDEACAFAPEEIYLYPLYVRELTGLGRRARRDGLERRRELYRFGRDRLRSEGYEQVSMRMFRRPEAGDDAGPEYCCQRDGMVGLGAGARSYTQRLHYSSEYAVGRSGVRSIVDEYCEREAHDRVSYGFELDGDEARRRWILQSLLQADGLDLADFEARFGQSAAAAVPELGELEALSLGEQVGKRLVLNDEGLALSDAIGPWLTSPAVRQRMEAYALR